MSNPYNEWMSSAEDVDYYFHIFCNAKSPLDQADALIRLRDSISDLRTFLPGYDYDSGTMPWEREDDE